MNRPKTLLLCLVCLLPVCGGIAAGPSLSPDPSAATNSVPAWAPVVVKSVFANDPMKGRDPFFPQSQRRLRALMTAPGTNQFTPNHALNQIALKGLSGPRQRRLALINNLTLAVGEQADLKVANQTIKVRCVEIRDHSAVISIDGVQELRELKLRDSL